jgi:hypothetical protein
VDRLPLLEVGGGHGTGDAGDVAQHAVGRGHQVALLLGAGLGDQLGPADPAADVVRREHGVQRHPLLGAAGGGGLGLAQLLVGGAAVLGQGDEEDPQVLLAMRVISVSSCSRGSSR